MCETNDAENVMDVLPYMCPEAIQSLEVENTRGPDDVWDFTKVVELEQWKNVEELDMNVNTVRGVRIEDYHHFRTAQVRLEHVTVDDIMKVKENFLNSPYTNKSLYLAAEESFPDEDQLKASLGQPYEVLEGAEEYTNDDEYIRYDAGVLYWFFRRPDDNVVRICAGGYSANFKIISSKNVPKGARVIG